MLTKNRRDVLKKRGSLEPRERAVYDYRLLQWLETMLDSGQEGGVGDINNVLDTLDREAIRKHLKDENVDDLLKLVERLLDILDFMPIGVEEKEMDIDGKKVKTKARYVQKSIAVVSRGGGEMSVLTHFKEANDEDLARHAVLENHLGQLKFFVETGAHIPESRSSEYFKKQIDDAHKKGFVALAYDGKLSGHLAVADEKLMIESSPPK